MTLSGVAARTPDGRTLFQDLSLSVARERTGVVGRNGAGKSTLLDLIAGEAEPAEGVVVRAGTVARLRQALNPSPGQAVDHVLGVAEARAVLTRLLASEGDEADMAEADWSLESRLDAALAEVGLAGLDPDRSVATLSGGERTRLGLAALRLKAPDLILLDEPTNHLDAEGRALVADWLGRWSGGAVVVSHDRGLLRRMDRIVELSQRGATIYGGGYGLYADLKAQERAAAEQGLAEAEREAARVKREGQKARERQARRDAAGRRFAATGSLPRIQAGLRADRAEDSGGRGRAYAERRCAAADAALETARERVEQVRLMDLVLPSAGLAAGKTVLRLDGVALRIGNRRLGPFDLALAGPERMAVTGPNGSGKTTLLKLISGELEPCEGRADRPVPAVTLDQHVGQLHAAETVIEAFRRLNPQATPNAAHTTLARFLFRNVEATKPVGVLSGGERLRAALACVIGGDRPPQLLLLDEPTNHLDLESVQAIETALRGYDGALVVVSHDRDFLEAVGVDRELRL